MLALGTAREWLGSGKPVGIKGACTHFGNISYRMRYDAAESAVAGEVEFARKTTADFAELCVRLPNGLRVQSVDAGSRAAVLPDGSGLRWEAPRGTVKFQAAVGK